MTERLLYVNFAIEKDEDGEKIYEEVKKKFRVVWEASYEFYPHGKTKIAILMSSHIALHTYPEEGYATLTLTTCKEEDNIFSELIHLISSSFTVNHILVS